MKKNILLVLAVMILVRCGYLDDYSQDMVVVKYWLVAAYTGRRYQYRNY